MARGGRGGAAGRGGGSGGGMVAVLDTIDANLLWHWETYKGHLQACWENFDGNNGQMIIVQNYILPALDEHLTEAEEYWPYSGGPREYTEKLMTCYDIDVMARAFSGEIHGSAYEVYEIWSYSANQLQPQHDDIMNDVFSGATEPHATRSNWRNG